MEVATITPAGAKKEAVGIIKTQQLRGGTCGSGTQIPEERVPASWCWCLCESGESYRLEGTCSVIQSCLTLCDPMDCRLPDSSVHGVL